MHSFSPPSRRSFGLRLLSGDTPGHPVASFLMAVLVFVLAFAPLLFAGTRAVATAARVAIFVVLAASYDLLLGYTGIVSFAHTLFFGLGAYGVAIALAGSGPSWSALVVGSAAGIGFAALLGIGIALLSLRVRAIFFSMITLAVASVGQVLASQLHDITGGEDGLTFSVPHLLSPSFHPFTEPVLGVRIDGRLNTYYLIFVVSLVLFLLLLRLVNSPFGRVLRAIRENEFRAEALGYRVVVYRSLASAIAAAMAAIAGALMALLLRYNGPATTLSFSIMIDILLMVVIGGMGTLYGPAIGAALMVLAQYYLEPALQFLAELTAPFPLLSAVFQPDRWLLWLGFLFMLVVMYFPAGIVGSLRARGLYSQTR